VVTSIHSNRTGRSKRVTLEEAIENITLAAIYASQAAKNHPSVTVVLIRGLRNHREQIEAHSDTALRNCAQDWRPKFRPYLGV